VVLYIASVGIYEKLNNGFMRLLAVMAGKRSI
jgi:hypothetical protein